jgi:hypothetical protein
MRPTLDNLDPDTAKQIVRKIICRKKELTLSELEESLYGSINASGQSIKRVLNRAINALKKDGKVKAYHTQRDGARFKYISQKA